MIEQWNSDGFHEAPHQRACAGWDDLARSLVFYRNGLNVPQELIVQAEDHFALHLRDDFSLVFFERSASAAILGRPVGASSSAEHIIGHAAASREEVDGVLNDMKSAGGTVLGLPKEEAWGYFGHVLDPDGHLWAIWWNPGSTAS